MTTKVCLVCGHEFDPYDDKHSKYCTVACSNRSERRQQQTKDRLRQRLENLYGPLTDRDITMHQAGSKRGYQRGYHTAMKTWRTDGV